MRGFLVLGLCIAGVITSAQSAAAADPQITINSAGGTAVSDGIRIVYQGGQWQILRQGTGQLYSAGSLPASSSMFNGIYLAISNGATGVAVSPAANIGSLSVGASYTNVAWDSVNTTGSSTTGSGSFTSDLSVAIGGLTYVVHLSASYVYPADYFTQTYTVDIPVGNTGTVRLYTPYDTYLGGSNDGPVTSTCARQPRLARMGRPLWKLFVTCRARRGLDTRRKVTATSCSGVRGMGRDSGRTTLTLSTPIRSPTTQLASTGILARPREQRRQWGTSSCSQPQTCRTRRPGLLRRLDPAPVRPP